MDTATVKQPETAHSKCVDDLFEYLADSGTPTATITRYREMSLDIVGVSAEEVYELLVKDTEAHPELHGTARKAGKFLYGATFEPSAFARKADEEVEALREQVANLESQLREAVADKNRAIKENALLRAENQELKKRTPAASEAGPTTPEPTGKQKAAAAAK